MTKKLLVRTPQTTDGTTLAYDDKKQPIYKETIVELGAKKNFESLNGQLPEHLRHEFEVVEVDDEDNILKPTKKPTSEQITNITPPAKTPPAKKATEEKAAGGESANQTNTATGNSGETGNENT